MAVRFKKKPMYHFQDKKADRKISFIKKEKTRYKNWHLPIFTPRRQGTIFGTTELNFRVRYGNGWTLSVINTN